MGMNRLACMVAALVAVASPVLAETRAVVELFTSQGCSSCPPADKLIGQFADDPSIIALSLPVDYWDYLGWKDTLALSGHSHRQHAYAKVRGDREVYTPQAVINGVAHALGSDRPAIEKAIVTSRRGPALSLTVKAIEANGVITVSVPAGKDERAVADVWLCPLSATVPVSVERGENRGHTLTYHNVVRRWIKVGAWNGRADSFRINVADLGNAKVPVQQITKLAVLVQAVAPTGPGAILGATILALR